MTASERRAANLARGTQVRQARARLKRALAAGDVDAAAVLAGADETWEPIAATMTLEKLIRACGHDPVDVLQAADALDLRAYRAHTLTAARRREIANHLEPL